VTNGKDNRVTKETYECANGIIPKTWPQVMVAFMAIE
jgi:hypothetical protein